MMWTFVEANRRLQFGGRELVCSPRALGALYHPRGPVACRVRLGGEIVTDPLTGLVRAEEYAVLETADATLLLHEFACWCAEEALKRERAAGREPDPRCWWAIEAKRRWLRSEMPAAELAFAGEDAAPAAWSGAWRAARAAARAAAGAAAWDRAWDETEAAQNAELERRLLALLQPDGGAR